MTGYLNLQNYYLLLLSLVGFCVIFPLWPLLSRGIYYVLCYDSLTWMKVKVWLWNEVSNHNLLGLTDLGTKNGTSEWQRGPCCLFVFLPQFLGTVCLNSILSFFFLPHPHATVSFLLKFSSWFLLPFGICYLLTMFISQIWEENHCFFSPSFWPASFSMILARLIHIASNCII